MPRRPDLSAVTAAVQRAGQSREAKPAASGTRRRRENTVPLTVHVDADVRTQVKYPRGPSRTPPFTPWSAKASTRCSRSTGVRISPSRHVRQYGSRNAASPGPLAAVKAGRVHVRIVRRLDSLDSADEPLHPDSEVHDAGGSHQIDGSLEHFGHGNSITPGADAQIRRVLDERGRARPLERRTRRGPHRGREAVQAHGATDMETTTTKRRRLERLRAAAEQSATETVGEWIARTRLEQRRPRALTRTARWKDAVADLAGSEFAQLLEGIRNVDLDAVDVELPREVGRNWRPTAAAASPSTRDRGGCFSERRSPGPGSDNGIFC